jgi:hypothetical protein
MRVVHVDIAALLVVKCENADVNSVTVVSAGVPSDTEYLAINYLYIRDVSTQTRKTVTNYRLRPSPTCL